MTEKEDLNHETHSRGFDSTKASKQELLDALDVEITNIRQDEQRQGWTYWTLLAALAATIWLFLNQIGESEFNLYSGFFVFLTLSVLIELITSITSIITPKKTFGKGLNRFHLAGHLLARQRQAILFFLISILFLLYIGFVCRDWVNDVSFIAFLLYYAGIGALIFLTFLLSFTRIPIIYPGHKLGRLFEVTVIVLFVIIAFGYVMSFVQLKSLINLPDYRFGGLLWVIIFVLSKLVIVMNKPMLLDTFVELRRDLMLGNIDTPLAARQLDIALNGLEVSDLLEGELEDILQLIRKVTKEIKSANENLEVIEAHLPDDANKSPTDEAIKFIKTGLEACSLHSKLSSEMNLVLGQRVKRLLKRIKLLSRFYPFVIESLEYVLGKVEEELNTAEKEMDIISKKNDYIEKRLVKHKENLQSK
jgi:hypothetical protein